MNSHNKSNVMNKKQFDADFKANDLKSIATEYETNGRPDKPARRMYYNDKMDSYHKSGIITNWQVNNWIIPTSFESTMIHH